MDGGWRGLKCGVDSYEEGLMRKSKHTPLWRELDPLLRTAVDGRERKSEEPLWTRYLEELVDDDFISKIELTAPNCGQNRVRQGWISTPGG